MTKGRACNCRSPAGLLAVRRARRGVRVSEAGLISTEFLAAIRLATHPPVWPSIGPFVISYVQLLFFGSENWERRHALLNHPCLSFRSILNLH